MDLSFAPIKEKRWGFFMAWKIDLELKRRKLPPQFIAITEL